MGWLTFSLGTGNNNTCGGILDHGVVAWQDPYLNVIFGFYIISVLCFAGNQFDMLFLFERTYLQFPCGHLRPYTYMCIRRCSPIVGYICIYNETCQQSRFLKHAGKLFPHPVGVFCSLLEPQHAM